MAAKFNFGELLVGMSPGALISATPEGEAMHWSKGAQAVFGHTSVEAAPVAARVPDRASNTGQEVTCGRHRHGSGR